MIFIYFEICLVIFFFIYLFILPSFNKLFIYFKWSGYIPGCIFVMNF